MRYEEIACPRCPSLNIKKNGITANQKQRYRCKDCGRQFITLYAYRACQKQVRQMIVPMTLNGSGIRDISRVLGISANTVVSIIRHTALLTTEPDAPQHVDDLEIDEFWSFVEEKDHQRWTWHAFDRQRKKIIAYQNGRRTDENCRALLDQLIRLQSGLLSHRQLGILSEDVARRDSYHRQRRNTKHRTTESEFQNPCQAIATAHDMFFKDRRNARCSDKALC